MPFGTLRVQLEVGEDTTGVDHDDRLRELCRELSDRPGVYCVTIDEHPDVRFKDGVSSR